MNYKELLHRALLLLSSPARAWEEISLEPDKRRVQAGFVFPLIGFCTLSVFVGALIDKGWGEPASFQYAMTECCAEAVALFGGFFLAAYLINRIGSALFILDDDLHRSQQFAGHGLVVVFVLQFILGLLPEFAVVAMLLQFYTFYIVWEGARTLMQVDDAGRVRFTVIASVLILLCPYLIGLVFHKLMNVLN